MTDPLAPQGGSPLVDQVADINARLNDITTQRTTYVAALVTANGTTTFDAKVSQPDGTFVTLAGIGASRTLMPAVGTTVSLALSGAQVVLVPSSVADGSLTIGSISSTAPSAPTGLTLSTATRTATDGTQAAIITASWTAPTTLVGGGAILGSLTYMVQYRVTGTINFSHQPATLVTTVLQVTSGVSYDVEVAAVDQLGNVGAFTAVSTITSAHDTAAPGTPSTPVVTNYLGQLKITWDGLIGGAAPPADFAYLEVHTSATTGFTPSSATLVGDLSAAGSSFATATYTTTMFAKFVAVDTSGNKSAASLQGSGSTSQVVSADIFNGAVGSAQLASLAVTTAKINLLAVNDAQIGNMSVGKLTAGTVSVDVVIGGRFTTALTGARVEMNSSGFQKFDSGGNLLVSFTGTDNYLHGEFKTATSGRRIEIVSAGATGFVDFYSPAGVHSWVKSWTESFGSAFEAINMGMDVGGHVLYNRVNVDNIPQIRLDSLQIVNAFPNGGLFQVLEYSSSASFTTGNRVRFQIIDDGLTYNATGGQTVIDVLVSNSQRIRFAPDGLGTGQVEIGLKVSNSESPRMYFYEGTGTTGTMIKSVSSHFEIRDTADTVCEAIFASAFTVVSDEEGKTDITDATLDGRALMKALRIRQYRRKTGPGPTDVGPVEIGLVAQEVPAQILGPLTGDGIQTVDLYQTVTLLAAGLQKGLADLDALTTRVASLGPPKP